MPPTSTVTRRRVRRHPLFRFGAPVLAAALAVPVGWVAITWGGSSPDSGESFAVAVPDERPGGLLMPDRASRSAPRVEEPASTTSTTVAVEVTQVAEERVIPIPEERHDDPALPEGDTRVGAAGSPGLERVVFEVTRRNGRVTAKRQISSETITPATPRVVFVGRGGGRGAPTDDVAEEVPLKLRLAAGEEAAAAGPARRVAAGGVPAAGERSPGDVGEPAPQEPKRTGGQQEGKASWYHHKPGTCAHRTLPKGTVVKVTNLENGKSASCTVADRGPFVAGRIIDLERGVFMAIAQSPGQGVIRVRIEW